MPRIFLSGQSAVHIDHVTQGLECEEGDADGQHKTGLGDHAFGNWKPGTKGSRNEVHIFEHKQDAKIKYHDQRQKELSEDTSGRQFLNPEGREIIKQDRCDHDQHKSGLPPRHRRTNWPAAANSCAPGRAEKIYPKGDREKSSKNSRLVNSMLDVSSHFCIVIAAGGIRNCGSLILSNLLDHKKDRASPAYISGFSKSSVPFSSRYRLSISRR